LNYGAKRGRKGNNTFPVFQPIFVGWMEAKYYFAVLGKNPLLDLAKFWK
jgi:hypothetical protein